MLLLPEITVEPSATSPEVVGLLAGRDCAATLRARLMQSSDDELAALRGVSTAEAIVLLAEPAALPWVDGVVFLRAVEGEPTVLLPTFVRLSIPEAIWARAVVLAHPQLGRPIVADPTTHTLIPLCEARPLARGVLEAWEPPR